MLSYLGQLTSSFPNVCLNSHGHRNRMKVHLEDIEVSIAS